MGMLSAAAKVVKKVGQLHDVRVMVMVATEYDERYCKGDGGAETREIEE